MSSPYIGEIRMFGGNFAPAGWAFCDGASVPIAENDTLFALIGTTYGGDGQSNFNLPDLRGRVPLHMGTDGAGNTYVTGEAAGAENVTLITQQLPAHSHAMLGSSVAAASASPANSVPASLPVQLNRTPYGQDPPFHGIDPSSIGPDGGSQPHTNVQPFLVVSFIISLFGVYPSQS
jgi:microcystin-dependent protein